MPALQLILLVFLLTLPLLAAAHAIFLVKTSSVSSPTIVDLTRAGLETEKFNSLRYLFAQNRTKIKEDKKMLKEIVRLLSNHQAKINSYYSDIDKDDGLIPVFERTFKVKV